MTVEKAEWSPSFDTELRPVDLEHRDLVQRLNALIDELSTGVPVASWLPALDELIRHVADHFAHEERVMENISYTSYVPHRNIHRQLLDEIALFRRELDTEQPLRDTLATVHFLKFWVLRHVAQEDIKLKKFVYDGGYKI